ncbi:hypothetical protein AMC90_PB00014 (plasmid) [Rhizobium phaseoli]|uniref:hypothetical protein n=1 Tax=Rhizobium TaxID=379 RepID=UPI0002EC371E|nr:MULTISPECIES: hypothetical protein [Rhizobium]ANK87942.1 hypothetical protein AMK02_PB00014 [Rhizobium sp. N731]ANL18188.1 hypothetical protein AMJ97_PB00014 [Rhizobium sp. N1314]ANL30332.1 hypothetical protein AMC90_PB00014 [Rhizobium phaseoli]
MKLDFHFWLKVAIARFRRQLRKPANAAVTRDEEQERSAREYELHYWGAMPGLWY